MEDYLLPPLFAVPIEDRVTALRDMEHALGQKEAAKKDEEEESEDSDEDEDEDEDEDDEEEEEEDSEDSDSD
jgi:hypothetical protein